MKQIKVSEVVAAARPVTAFFKLPPGHESLNDLF